MDKCICTTVNPLLILVIKAERVSSNGNASSTSYVKGNAQLMVPSSLLQDNSKYSE